SGRAAVDFSSQIRRTHGFVGSGIFVVRPLHPTPSLAFVGPVVIGLLIGLVLGVVATYLVVRAQYTARLVSIEDARGQLEVTMKALASDALSQSSRSFLELAKSQLEQLQKQTTSDLEQRKQAVEHLVAPLKESLTKVDGKLQEL